MTDLCVGMFSEQRNGYVNLHLNCELHHQVAENLWRHKLIRQLTKEVPGFGHKM